MFEGVSSELQSVRWIAGKSLVALIAVSAGLVLFGRGSSDNATASHGGNAFVVDLVAVDMDPAGNTPLSLPNAQSGLPDIQQCGSVAVGGQTTFDVVIDEIPEYTGFDGGIIGFDFYLTYDPSVVKIVSAAPFQSMIAALPGSGLSDLSEPLPDTDGSWAVSMLDLVGPIEDGEGILLRVTVEGVTNGTSSLDVSNSSQGQTYVADHQGAQYPINNIQDALIRAGFACEPIELLALDMDTLGNTATSVGAVDPCVSLSGQGDTAEVDLLVKGVPEDGTDGFELRVNYDPAMLQILDYDYHFMLEAMPGHFMADYSDPVPDSDGSWLGVTVDLSGQRESGDGVLVRLTVRAGAYSGLTFLSLSGSFGPDPLIVTEGGSISYSINTMSDGLVAIGGPCPTPTDLTVSSGTTLAPPIAAAGASFPVEISGVIENLTGATTVNADVVFDLLSPVDCDGGYQQQFLVDDVTLSQGTPVTLAHEFSLTCLDNYEHMLPGRVTVVLDDPNAVESNHLNNQLSADAATIVFQAGDSDGDGIGDAVDSDADTFSNDFSDLALGGTTSGTVTDRGGLQITVIPTADCQPLLSTICMDILAYGLGPAQATITRCGFPDPMTLTPGDRVKVACGSVSTVVVSGPVEATYGTILVTMPADTTVTLTDLGGGRFEVVAGTDNVASLVAGGYYISPGATLIVEDPDGDGVINQADNCSTVANPVQENGDGDSQGDACEPVHCASVPNWWTSPPDDPDCDGFPSTLPSGNLATEAFLETDPNSACSADSSANTEDPDAWPLDFNDDQKANILDVARYGAPVLNSTAPGPPYSVRLDLNQDSKNNILDVARFGAPILNKVCA